jgi:ABC-type glutathione transport system ATPase component
MSAILEVRNMQKSFKGFSLQEISFSMERGYIMGFIGPNGAGKSTTIKLIYELIMKQQHTLKLIIIFCICLLVALICSSNCCKRAAKTADCYSCGSLK